MSHPATGPIRPTIHRFTWGKAEIMTIMDGAQTRQTLRPPFMLDKGDAELAAIAAAARLPHDMFENTYVPTVVNTGSEVVLFDTGFGSVGRGDGPTQRAGLLRERLWLAGYAPEDIDVVAFTHVHPDHILGVMEGDDLAFPNARHVIGQVEFDEWISGANIPEQRAQNREMFLRLIAPLADRLTYVKGGDAIASGIVAEEAFGHSLGHMMYRVDSDGRDALIWGDVTNHYAFSLPHPDSLVGFDDDKEQAKATRKRVLDMAATDQTLVVGHHMPFPSVGYVERTSDSYRWAPATYQLWA